MDVPPQVLVIDDDRDMRWALRTILESIGLTVAEANAGPAGLEIAARGQPAAVLLDMKIPGLGGHEVLTHLRARHPALPIIVITGYGTIQGAVSTIRAGAFDYMIKPFDNDEVISTVRRAIAQHCPGSDQAKGSLKETITEMMGCGTAIQNLITQIEAVVNTDYSVVVGGETGTGKRLWHKHCTDMDRGRRGHLSCSIAGPSAKRLSPRSCSATNAALIRMPMNGGADGLKSRRAVEQCSWTRLATFAVLVSEPC